MAEGIAAIDCSCTLAQDAGEKIGGDKSAKENPALLFRAKQARSECVMCDARREGEECELSAEFWGSFESSLHNQPSFQVNSELSHPGLFQTTASERETQHTHSGARTHVLYARKRCI